MDLSKLPKLSETPKPPSNDPPPDDQRVSYDRANVVAVDAGAGAMVWFSMFMGILCMLIGRSFAGYLFATLGGREYNTGFTWSFGEKAGQNVGYWDIEGGVGWTHAGIFLFGLALILEGMALAFLSSNRPGKKLVLSLALTAVVLATIVNLITAVKVFNIGQIPIMSGLAIAFGGYMAIYQWKLLRVLSTGRSAPMT